MGDTQTIKPEAAAPAESTTTAAAAPVVASVAAPAQASLEQARAEGATAERVRVAAILGHANASANPAITQQCITTGLSAEQAKGFLDVAPAAAVAALAPAATNQFAQAMAAMGNPDVSGVEAAAPDSAATASAQTETGWGQAFGYAKR